MSELINKVYAGSQNTEVIVQTIEIQVPHKDPIMVCSGYDNFITQQGVYECGNLAITRPKRSDSTEQTISFAIWNVQKRAHKEINDALESGEQTPILYREYLDSDRENPAIGPIPFTMVGGSFKGMLLTVSASYFDALNTQWPRERFNIHNAPGLQYL